MKQFNNIIKNILVTAIVMSVFCCLSLTVERVFQTYSPIPALFALAVIFVSLLTEGYLYSIVASLISVLALNFAFTFPYFKFNFIIPENAVSAVVMLSITLISSTLMRKIRENEKMQMLAEKEKMRANLLRAVSHDLRSPLTTIYGSSSMIVEQVDELSKEQLVQLAKGMKEDSQWLIGMVENLLSVTRVDGQRVNLIKQNTVLEELIDTVLVRFKKKYPSQKVTIEIPDEFIMVPMDAMLIEQVIVNLLENAVIHAEGMTKLVLKVLLKEQEVVFEIIDDGCGISKEKIPYLFEDYYEKKQMSADSRKRNMGIGLSVCASIITAHGGTINAENLKPKGSCFRFVLEMEEDINE